MKAFGVIMVLWKNFKLQKTLFVDKEQNCMKDYSSCILKEKYDAKAFSCNHIETSQIWSHFVNRSLIYCNFEPSGFICSWK